MLWAGLHPNNIEQVNDHQKHTKDAADHDQSPRKLMGALILFADGSHFRLRENTQRNEAGGEAEADNPVEHVAVSFLSLALCGVFAQKKGAFASSQIARYAAIECSGQ